MTLLPIGIFTGSPSLILIAFVIAHLLSSSDSFEAYMLHQPNNHYYTSFIT